MKIDQMMLLRRRRRSLPLPLPAIYSAIVGSSGVVYNFAKWLSE